MLIFYTETSASDICEAALVREITLSAQSSDNTVREMQTYPLNVFIYNLIERSDKIWRRIGNIIDSHLKCLVLVIYSILKKDPCISIL